MLQHMRYWHHVAEPHMRQRHVRDVCWQRHTDIQLQRGDAADVVGVVGVWGMQHVVR